MAPDRAGVLGNVRARFRAGDDIDVGATEGGKVFNPRPSGKDEQERTSGEQDNCTTTTNPGGFNRTR